MTTLGANLHPGGGLTFGVWAPRAERLGLEILPSAWGTLKRFVDLQRDGEIWRGELEGVRDGDLYELVLPDGRRRPDPRSLRQPDGVHGPSAVVDLAALGVRPRPALPAPRDWVIYELHPGTFTPGGTLDAAAQALPYLGELGVSAVELMPLSSFPGARNWGYDGVAPFAVQESYGGPAALARFVNAAHDLGLAVIVDVVYNHLGPEGNYLRDFAPYFTDHHDTPWGEAIDYGNLHVRRWAIENALQWATAFQVDGLRLDAIHAIFDDSPRHVLAELAAAVQPHGCAVISESDLNDPVTVLPRDRGGWGHDAQWSDDLHHALHALLTSERGGYYQDFGEAHHVQLALQRGFVYDGSLPSPFRGGRRHGKSAGGVPAERHVVCLQNHDQVGNRARGDRISHLVGAAGARVGAASVLLAPGIPLLFMGEEYAARQPFPYFTSHGDPQLAQAVTEGRRREFASFAWQGEVPDPQDPATFAAAVLQLEERTRPGHRGTHAWYRRLLALRREHPALRGENRGERTRVLADDPGHTVILERTSPGGSLLAVLAYAKGTAVVRPPVEATWKLLLDSASTEFDGPGGAAPPELRPGDALRPSGPVAWIYGR
jgi:maltooligosyltrehalose trehalohydrolase